VSGRPRVAGGFRAGALDGLLRVAVGRLGLPLMGVEILTTTGRRSGLPREVPVLPLDLDGARYLVAPRGTTAWSRNLRAGGPATLGRGRRRTPVRAEEVPAAGRPPVLAAYIRANRRLNGRFFDVGDPPADEELRRIAGHHAVLRILPA
jgi:deazaflavin-dependent oxidoreductase (nitroreductase family)